MLIENLSKKQLLSYQESKARINIWQGAVRSGKSFSSLIRFLKYIVYGPKGDLMIVARTQDTLKRNIIGPLADLVGLDLRHHSGKRELSLYDRTIHLVGASDERAEQKIRGVTLAGAYVDEVTLIPESFFNMLLSRLSIPGAQVFGTTNPDSPYHWLKTQFLDRTDELDLKTWHFSLEDNPSLTDLFKENIKKEYKGLWYKRLIDGLWVQAEGAVFDFFDANAHTLINLPNNAKYYMVGIDYGTTNPTAFTLIGYNPDNYPNLWLEDEYFWDSRVKQRQKTDSEYAEDFLRFIKGKYIRGIVIDPSAASFKAELIKQGCTNLMDANNDVLDGIRFHSKLLSNGTFKISRTCANTIKEYCSYAWDEKSIRKGLDQPLKINDHCLDSIRYILYTHFKPIFDGNREMDVQEYRKWKKQQGWA